MITYRVRSYMYSKHAIKFDLSHLQVHHTSSKIVKFREHFAIGHSHLQVFSVVWKSWLIIIITVVRRSSVYQPKFVY